MTSWYTTKRMEGAGGFSGARDESQGRWGKEPQPEVTGAPGEALSGTHLAYCSVNDIELLLAKAFTGAHGPLYCSVVYFCLWFPLSTDKLVRSCTMQQLSSAEATCSTLPLLGV